MRVNCGAGEEARGRPEARGEAQRQPSGPARGGYAPLAFPTVDLLSMELLYGRAGRLTAKNGGFRPGQSRGARPRARSGTRGRWARPFMPARHLIHADCASSAVAAVARYRDEVLIGRAQRPATTTTAARATAAARTRTPRPAATPSAPPCAPSRGRSATSTSSRAGKASWSGRGTGGSRSTAAAASRSGAARAPFRTFERIRC